MKISLLIMLSLLMALIECSEITTQTELEQVNQAIKQTWDDYLKLWEQGEASACAAFFTEDAINMPSLNSTQRGADEIEAMFANLFSTTKVKIIQQRSDEIFVHEDMAYEFGSIEQVFQQQGVEPDTVKIRYISVFKQQSDGSWKWFRWLGQSG